MEKVLELIKQTKMFAPGDVVGVGVSGGSDSIALLHLLNENKEDLDIDVVAINVDHCLREESALDSAFVQRFCRTNHIRLFKFRVDCAQIAKSKKMSVEAAAREGRYGMFDTLLKKGLVDKIATAHHVSDQAETVLLHILRGSGLSGAKGMSLIRGNYVKPFLFTEKYEINAYIYNNKLEYVEDESNYDTRFQRNFIRNKVLPLIRQEWRSVDKTLASFASLCAADDDFINKFALTDGIINDELYVKVPLTYFSYDKCVVARILFKALSMAGLETDVERKHINDIFDLYEKENGTRIDLPGGAKAIKEYEYITLTKQDKKIMIDEYKFKAGKTSVPGYGSIYVKKTVNLILKPNVHLIDCAKLPKGATWRKRQEGDIITKFGGGTKKLKSFLIEKKVPARLRDNLPVLAYKNEVCVVASVDISEKVKIDENTKSAYAIEYVVE